MSTERRGMGRNSLPSVLGVQNQGERMTGEQTEREKT